MTPKVELVVNLEAVVPIRLEDGTTEFLLDHGDVLYLVKNGVNGPVDRVVPIVITTQTEMVLKPEQDPY